MFDTKTTWLLGALLLGAVAPAQQDREQPPAAQAPSAQAEFQQLTEAFTTAQREYSANVRAEIEAARKEGRQLPALSMAGPVDEWLPRFKAGAEKYKGTDGAVPFLIWVGNNSRDEDREDVLATLLRDHIGSAELGGALRLITSLNQPRARMIALGGARPAGVAEPKGDGEARVRELLGKVIAESPHADVQAQALLARANLVLGARDKADAAALPSAIADVRKAGELAVDPALKAQCEGILFEQDHLAIGMTAPDIEGPDLDGIEFKLSDYRGKVVLLDYWGYW